MNSKKVKSMILASMIVACSDAAAVESPKQITRKKMDSFMQAMVRKAGVAFIIGGFSAAVGILAHNKYGKKDSTRIASAVVAAAGTLALAHEQATKKYSQYAVQVAYTASCGVGIILATVLCDLFFK